MVEEEYLMGKVCDDFARNVVTFGVTSSSHTDN